jgi:hypothetical protein
MEVCTWKKRFLIPGSRSRGLNRPQFGVVARSRNVCFQSLPGFESHRRFFSSPLPARKRHPARGKIGYSVVKDQAGSAYFDPRRMVAVCSDSSAGSEYLNH